MTFTKNIVIDYGAPTDDGVSDSAPAFANFRTDARVAGDDVLLTIPAHRYEFDVWPSGLGQGRQLPFDGISELVVSGYGATLAEGDAGYILGSVIYADGHSGNNFAAKIATVSAGATSVFLIDPAQTDTVDSNGDTVPRVVVGNWMIVYGIDLQGFGEPANAQFFEYVQVTDIDDGTGEISFTPALKYSYKSTWPFYSPGSDGLQPDLGGSATIMGLNPAFDISQEYQGFDVDNPADQIKSNGRHIVWRDLTVASGAIGLIPSFTKEMEIYDCDFGGASVEIDKLVDEVYAENFTVHALAFQSPAPNKLTLANPAIERINGTPKECIVTGGSIDELALGPYAYGVAEKFSATGTAFATSFDRGGFKWPEGPLTDACTMAGGVITLPKTWGEPPQWAIPGAPMLWAGYHDFCPPGFRVLDVWEDVDNTYIQTSLSGGFPDIPDAVGGFGPPSDIAPHPCPRLSVSGLTGCPEAVSLNGSTPLRPWGEYFHRNYTSAPHAFDTDHYARVFGWIKRITITVNTAYTGVSSLNLVIDPWSIESDYKTVRQDWVNTIDVKTAGTRVITPGAVTGSAGADSITAPGRLWLILTQLGPYFSRDISGESSGLWPDIDVTVETDQELTPDLALVTPLRFRFHS